MKTVDVFAGGGVAGACAAAVDWSRTAVGPIEAWPASLRTILGVLFRSRHPMFLYWGPELIQFYNDGYIPSFGAGRHPTAMGQSGPECWAEIWPVIGPEIEDVYARGASYWHEDHLVPILRNGAFEDVYWTYGFSPVLCETGIGGVLVVVTETTARVTAERRLVATRLLGERTRSPVPDLPNLFAGMEIDVPMALAFAIETGELRVTASWGLSAAELAQVKPFFRTRPHETCTNGLLAGMPLTREGLAQHVYFAALGTPGEAPTGFVALGINPSIPFDIAYCSYLEQLAHTLADAATQVRLRADQELSRRQLVIADRMASVGTLAAGLAHEINNPLTFVTANLDLVLEQIRDLAGGSPSSRFKELEAMVIDAQGGAERVGKIVRGLKTFARSGDGHRVRIELEPVIELAINLAFNELRHRAVLVKDYGGTPAIDADDARLAHVFIHLLINAAQAIPEGHFETNEIRISTSTDAAGRAIVEIHDSGPGIPDHVIGRIFEPFFTTKEVGIGTGLGLSICHNIISGMGGEITVTSAPGLGTTFRVALLPAAGIPAAVEVSPPPVTAEHRRASVMILEDESAIRVVLARALREHDLTIVTSVAEALIAVSSGQHFDLILSDLMLPEVTGMEFHDEVQRSHPALATRMVFVTGGASTPAARAFLERVPNERMEKPFTVQAIRALVRRLVSADQTKRAGT